MRPVGGDADAECRVLRGEIMRSRACSTCRHSGRSPISLANACADVVSQVIAQGSILFLKNPRGPNRPELATSDADQRRRNGPHRSPLHARNPLACNSFESERLKVGGEGGIRTLSRPLSSGSCGFYIDANATNAGGAVAPCTRLHARTSCVRAVLSSNRRFRSRSRWSLRHLTAQPSGRYMRTMAHASAAVCAPASSGRAPSEAELRGR